MEKIVSVENTKNQISKIKELKCNIFTIKGPDGFDFLWPDDKSVVYALKRIGYKVQKIKKVINPNPKFFISTYQDLVKKYFPEEK